jgi:hypothetical protein
MENRVDEFYIKKSDETFATSFIKKETIQVAIQHF